MEDSEDGLREDVLRKASLFQDCPDGLIQKLLPRAEREIYRNDEIILFQGVISSQLFIIASGRVAVSSRKGKEKRFLAELGEGDFFGEISLMRNCATTAAVKAVSEAEIYTLSREAVYETLADFPEAKARMEALIYERNRKRFEAFERGEPEEDVVWTLD
ncbi:MAG: cyclic nucleotide-binding domain-containing protein [Elusimicrobiota bacterium]